MKNIIAISIISMAGLGFFFAAILAFVNQKLKVKEDPIIDKLVEVLPGVNCGACGLASCHQYAVALAEKKLDPDKCKAGGESVAKALSEILGVEVEHKIKEIAVIHCGADNTKRIKKANYTGIKTCLAANSVFGGEISCEYGCLGYGDCTKVCPFDAITMVNGLPKVNKNKCTACAKCVGICPRTIISIQKLKSESLVYIACKNKDAGASTRKACTVGCIGCGICQKMTTSVFHVEENLAEIDYEKIESVKSGEVITKCPTKCIRKI